MILTFLHKACVQRNEHPLSCTSGRVWRRTLQTAFSKFSIVLVTLGGRGRIDITASRTAFSVVSPFLPGHYDENQWHLPHVIIILHKGV